MNDKAAILKEIAKNLVGLADGLNKLAESKSESPKVEELKLPPPQNVTLEEVRSVLASLSAEGKTAQVRDLIEKYGATKLSEVDPVHYAGLLEDAKNVS